MTRDEFTEHADEFIAHAKFEVLDRLSSAWYGKQMFFMQDDSMVVYDRFKGGYITLDKAIDRMARILMLEEDRIC